MKLVDQPRIEILYKQINLIIPVNKTDLRLLQQLLDSLGKLDTSNDYDISIATKKKKRSLSANSYYWQLLNQLAKKINVPPAEVHNQCLIRYGVPDFLDDGTFNWTMKKDSYNYMQSETEHLYPTDVTEERKGILYRWFYPLKPSHKMDTAEMAKLIDGIVGECQEIGIETKTPAELEELKQKWGVV